MNKKNTGATIGVLVAVSIGATAYASAMTNLDKDTYSKTLLENKVSYVEPEYKAKLSAVNADYTKDVENTKIGESERKLAVKESEESATLYEALNEVSEDEVQENIEPEDNTEKTLEKEETKEEKVEEEKVEEEKVEETTEETTDLNESDGEILQVQADLENKSYESNNSVDSNNESEEEIVKNTYAEMFVNVEYLNVRSEASIDSDILTTIEAGDKVSGNIEGEWLKTESGYVNLNFLTDTYPEALVNAIEERRAEEERQAQEEAQRKAEEERKAQEEAQRKAEEEKKAQEEAQRKAEEERKAQEEAERNKAVDYTGWVNTPGLNIRSYASTKGRILGSLTKGDKITGVLQNGWIKFNFNGSQGFVSASYVVDYEVAKPAPAPKQQAAPQNNNPAPAVQQANGSGQEAANIAQRFQGYPYVFGANDPSVGFDCSGLVYYAYKQLGVNLARNSAAQFYNGYAVDINNLVPGDLIFFSTGGTIDHVGMITGYDGTFIHASTPGTGVIYSNIFSSYYQSSFAGARRIF